MTDLGHGRERADQAATALASELASTGPRLAKISTLVRAFDLGAVAGKWGLVHDALQRAGVIVDAGWHDRAGEIDARRSGVVTLSLDRPASSGIALERWMAYGSLAPESSTGGVLWVDAWTGTSEADLMALTDACPGLTPAAVRNLCDPDEFPEVETFTGKERVRRVSMVGAIAFDVPNTDAIDGRDEVLSRQLVEVAVGPGWLVCFWHDPGGIGAGTRFPAWSRWPLKESVRRRCRSDASTWTSSDLALALGAELVATYDASNRQFERWLSDWEVLVYGDRADDVDYLQRAADEVRNLHLLNAEIRRGLSAFRRGRRATADEQWFPDVSDPRQVEALARAVDQGLTAAEQAADAITSGSSALMVQLAAAQHQAAERQQKASERTRGMIELVAALILVPSLITALFGVNTAIPGAGTWWGFVVVLCLMAVSGLGTWLLLRRRT